MSVYLSMTLLILLFSQNNAQIVPIDNEAIKGSEKSTSKLDISALKSKSMNLLENISVQLYPRSKSMEFNNSYEVSSQNYFHGVGKQGSTLNLLKSLDQQKGEEFVIGSIVDFETKNIHLIRRNSLGETIVTSKADKDFPESKEPKYKESEFVTLTNSNVTTQATSIIDIMIVWTKTSECANSDLSSNCSPTATTTSNMKALSELSVQYTNTAFQLSGVDAKLRLVHSYLDSSYNERSIGDALQDLTSIDDGKLDDVHAMREKYKADMVALLVDDFEFCGIAWIGPRITRMFSVTYWFCAGGSSFAHELGHNFGCYHDRGTSQACNSDGYQYGYRDPNAEFRDIMAYNCRPDQCDNIKGNWCPRAQMFSNTVNKQDNKKIGDSSNNCARRINEVREEVAAYFKPNASTKKPKSPARKRKKEKKLKKKLKKQKKKLKKKLKKEKKKLKKQKKKIKKQKKKLKKQKKKLKKVSNSPSINPTKVPSIPPSKSPTLQPSESPSLAPSFTPSYSPSSNFPSMIPSAAPSLRPSGF